MVRRNEMGYLPTYFPFPLNFGKSTVSVWLRTYPKPDHHMSSPPQQNYSPEDIFRMAQENWEQWRKPLLGFIIPITLVAIGIWSSYYTVPANGVAVVKRFGEVVAVTEPGLHFKIPFGVDEAVFVPTERVMKEEFGYRTRKADRKSTFDTGSDFADESLMLTGDLNVIDVEWAVQYRVANDEGNIGDPRDSAASRWLHVVDDPRGTIRDISEAVMRRVIGNHLAVDALTEGRMRIQEEVLEEMREVLDDYNMGVFIRTVNLQNVTPPTREVRHAYNEVNEAQQEKEQLINEAESYRNQVLPQARGEAAGIVAAAEGFRAKRVNAAKGDAERFKSVLAEYNQAKDITRRRMYLEAMNEILPNIEKLYIMEPGQSGPLPLLQLPGPLPSAKQ